MMLLNEGLPQFLVVLRHKIEGSWQAKIMPVVGQYLHAKAVNRPEECAIERGLHRRRAMLLQNQLPCPLLHFVRRAMGKSHDDQPRKDVERVRSASVLHD